MNTTHRIDLRNITEENLDLAFSKLPCQTDSSIKINDPVSQRDLDRVTSLSEVLYNKSLISYILVDSMGELYKKKMCGCACHMEVHKNGVCCKGMGHIRMCCPEMNGTIVHQNV